MVVGFDCFVVRLYMGKAVSWMMEVTTEKDVGVPWNILKMFNQRSKQKKMAVQIWSVY